MAIVAPGIVRYSINQSQGTVENPIVNVFDVDLDPATGTRSDAIFLLAGDILNNWADVILPNLSDLHRFESVSWVDLDTATGETGERTETSTNTLPQQGGVVAEPVPINAALLVDKTTARARGQRNGRMYIGSILGTDVLNNTLTAAAVTAWNTDIGTFLSNIQDFDRTPVVVHTTTPSPGAPPVFVSSTPITAMTVQSRLATQRRRLR